MTSDAHDFCHTTINSGVLERMKKYISTAANVSRISPVQDAIQSSSYR